MEIILILISWLILLVPGFDDSIPPTDDKIFKITISSDVVEHIETIQDESLDFQGFDIKLKQNATGYLDISIPKNLPRPSSYIDSWKFNERPIILADGKEITSYKGLDDQCFSHFQIPVKEHRNIEVIYGIQLTGTWKLYTPIDFEEKDPCYQKTFHDKVIPPLKQIQSGIHYNDVHCRDDRVLVLKQSEEFASCVYKETVMKLFQRGWALPEAPIVDTNTIQQESKLIKITGIINRFDTIEGFEYQLIPLEEELPRIAYTGYDTINLLSTKDTVHQFIRDIDGDLVKVHGRFILNDQGEYKRHFSGFPIIPAEKVEKISENLDLAYTINGAEIISITKLHEANTVNIVLDESNGGSLTISIPREILDATIGVDDDAFFVLIDGKEISYTETANETSRTLTIDFEKGTRIIEIIGTVPI